MEHVMDTHRGVMESAIHAFPWSSTPLGPISAWPEELSLAVAQALRSEHPTVVAWGTDLIQIYNDAFIPVLRERHPSGLGKPVRVCWAEAWQLTGPIFESVLRTGLASHLNEQRITLTTAGVDEHRFFNLSYTPIRSVGGAVGGVLVVSIETTASHLLKTFGQ